MRNLHLLLALIFTACDTVTKYGDARYVVPGPVVLFPHTDGLEFPDVPIGHPAHYHFAVRNLPEPMYPHVVDLLNAPSRWPPGPQPWAGSTLSVRLTALDGTVFLQHTLAFENGRNGVAKSDDKFSVPEALFLDPFRRKDLQYLSYDVDIEVLTPSRRATDKVRIYGH